MKSHQSLLHNELAQQFSNQNFSAKQTTDYVTDWLGQKMLLNDIPFHYLIPSPDMLPNNSIRFFYINNNWLLSFIDGACSIGRNTSYDIAHDQTFINHLFERANKKSKAIRSVLQKKVVSEETFENIVQQPGGFILRSPLVRGWRGLEFTAYRGHDGDSDNIISALRIETLADDVLIGLYHEIPMKLTISQPPEGMHFGVRASDNQCEISSLRDLSSGVAYKLDKSIKVPLKSSQYRIVDVVAMSESIKNELNKKHSNEVDDFTSAEFALQMIKAPYMGIINIEKK